MGEREFVFPASVVFARDTIVGVEFTTLNLQQQMDLVQCTLARADAWLDWGENRMVDRPLAGFKEILYHSMRGYQHLGFYLRKMAGDVYRNKTEDKKPEPFYLKIARGPTDRGLKANLLQKLGGIASMGRALMQKSGDSLRGRSEKRS